MSEILKKQLSDAEAAGRRIAKQLFEVEKERDALAAKLKDQDARINDLLATCHRLALELECLLLDTKDAAPVSRWWDSAMAALDGWHKAKDAASVRPVPAEPVNARLIEALRSIQRYGLDTLSGRADGGDDDRAWQRAAVNEMTKRARIALSAAEAQQAEPVRLTDEQINGADETFQEAPFWRVVKFARTIEAAVLRANGFKVEG